MRPIPIRFPALLAAAVFWAAPAAAQSDVAVRPANLRSLQARLDGFAAGLPAEERALWDGLLLRAATAPTPGGEVRVSPVLQIGPGGGCEIGPGGGCEGEAGVDGAANRVAIIVQGGRTALPASGIVVQGGRTAMPSSGIVVQGGRTATPSSGIVVQGGRTPAVQDDPGAPRPANGAIAIGPKQDDPAPPPQSLSRRLAVFAQQLPEAERGAMDWLLTRAAAAPEGRPGTPGGLPPGTQVSLRQALGIDALAIGPKQDDPAPPPPAGRWIIRY